MLRRQSPFWCIPPALASSWPRAPAPTTETFQGFSGSVFTLQHIALSLLSVSARWTKVTFSHPNILLRELATASKIPAVLLSVNDRKLNPPTFSDLEDEVASSISARSHGHILPLSAGGARVNAMISLRLLLQWAGAVDLRFKSM